MARPQTYDSEALINCTLATFWSNGYNATSMDILVKETGVSRHGLYKEFGNKRAMLLACFAQYQKTVVSPAFSRVEAFNATTEDIRSYFEHQISLAEEHGLPGPGCFVANSSTEVAPHDADVAAAVQRHHDRLVTGFSAALRNTRRPTSTVSDAEIMQIAQSILVFATGLWSLSRTVSNAHQLRETTHAFITRIERDLR